MWYSAASALRPGYHHARPRLVSYQVRRLWRSAPVLGRRYPTIVMAYRGVLADDAVWARARIGKLAKVVSPSSPDPGYVPAVPAPASGTAHPTIRLDRLQAVDRLRVRTGPALQFVRIFE